MREILYYFGSTYTKIGTIQRRLAWPLRKDDTQNREAFHIFCPQWTHVHIFANFSKINKYFPSFLPILLLQFYTCRVRSEGRGFEPFELQGYIQSPRNVIWRHLTHFCVYFSGPIVILQLSINCDNAKNSCKWILRLCQNIA